MCQKFIKWVNINHEFIWDLFHLNLFLKIKSFQHALKEPKIKGNNENTKKVRKIRK